MNKKLHPTYLCALSLWAASAMAQTTTTTTTATPATTPATPAAATPAAPAPETPPSWSFTFTPTYVNQYMFRGQRLGGSSFEPSIEADYGNFAIGVWSNFPLADKVPGQSDPEIDPYGSYTFAINDSLSIQPGFTLYTYINAPKDQGFYQLTFEPNIALNYTVGNLKLTPKLYYDFVLKGPTWEFTAAYTVPLKAISSELDFTGVVGTYLLTDVAYNTNPKVRAWGNYWLVGVGMPFTITKSSKLTVGFAYTKGSDAFIKQDTFGKAANSEAVGRGVVSVAYAITFP